MADPEPLEVGEEEAEEDADESPLFVAFAVREGLPVREEVEDPEEEAVGEAVEVRALEALADDVREAVEERALEALAEDVLIRVASAETVLDDNEEPVGADEPVLVTVREDVHVEERVAELVQERSMVEPSAQSATQPQGEHVTLDDAPSAGENLPAGQGVGFTEERGQ